MKNYDIFISHCSKDKLKYVDDLVEEIKKLNISVFYDSVVNQFVGVITLKIKLMKL